MIECIVAKLGGLPMIDDHAQTSALATLVCGVRQRIDNNKQLFTAYLQPDLAKSCYAHSSKQAEAALRSVTPTPEEMHAIERSCREVVSIVPAWQTLFSLPLIWRCLFSDLFSSSNPRIPQHIYLGRKSIQSPHLSEYIVHEVSHTWVGLISEIASLARDGAAIHVLPSGTKGKTIDQVLYALTFSCTATRFYRAKNIVGRNAPNDADRLNYLRGYAKACLSIVQSSNQLTSDGAVIVESCRRFLSSIR